MFRTIGSAAAVAFALTATSIVTGNTAHFPSAALEPVRVLTPRQLLDEVVEGR